VDGRGEEGACCGGEGCDAGGGDGRNVGCVEEEGGIGRREDVDEEDGGVVGGGCCEVERGLGRGAGVAETGAEDVAIAGAGVCARAGVAVGGVVGVQVGGHGYAAEPVLDEGEAVGLEADWGSDPGAVAHGLVAEPSIGDAACEVERDLLGADDLAGVLVA